MSESHDKIMRAPSVDISAQRAEMHPMVAAVISSNPSTETVREMMALQREWEADNARKSFTRSMVAMKEELPRVIKHDKTVDFSSAKGRTFYTHTSLAALIEAVTDTLTKYGFSVAFVPQTSERAVQVTCVLTHRDGHSESSTISAAPDSSGNKNPAQGVASTITYLQRYTLCSMLGLATAEHGESTSQQNETIDSGRNLRALARLKSHGVTLEQAEAHIGHPVQKWTGSDLEKLPELVAKQTAVKVSEE